MSDSNYFKCPNCQKVTKHLKITFREFVTTQASLGQDDLGIKNDILKSIASNFSGIFGDVTQIPMICGSTPYKCAECTCLTMRKSSGEAEETVWPR